MIFNSKVPKVHFQSVKMILWILTEWHAVEKIFHDDEKSS